MPTPFKITNCKMLKFFGNPCSPSHVFTLTRIASCGGGCILCLFKIAGFKPSWMKSEHWAICSALYPSRIFSSKLRQFSLHLHYCSFIKYVWISDISDGFSTNKEEQSRRRLHFTKPARLKRSYQSFDKLQFSFQTIVFWNNLPLMLNSWHIMVNNTAI